MSTPLPHSLSLRFPIRAGAHPRREDGLCAMEMVAWLAGERHSDGPECACPVLAAVVRAFNDALPSDEERSRHLRPIVPRLVNSRRDARVERQRGLLVADYAVRVFAPIALERGGDLEGADALRRLPPVMDRASALCAAAALRLHGPAVEAAAWLAARAAGILPPSVWAGVVVRQAGVGADPRTHALLGLLVEQLLVSEQGCEAIPVAGLAEPR